MPTLRPKTHGAGPAGYRFDSALPAASLLAMLPFFRPAFAIKRSLDAALEANEGVVTYTLVADLGRREFRVASTWVDQAACHRWVGTEVHRSAMAALGPRVRGATFDAGPIEP